VTAVIGLGCMRLSTAKDRDEDRSRAVLAAALAANIPLLGTSDAYAWEDAEIGHNERLIAQAIGSAETPRRPIVVTKGGLERPGGAWVTNGRARHLDAAARGSRERLGVPALDGFLLHAVDPKTPLTTSVRALAKLRDAGVAAKVGLSNVGVHQLEGAREITAIDYVEVELSPYKLDALRGGLVARCRNHGITLLAHRPLGGPAGLRRLARDTVVTDLATRAGLTSAELALVWLATLGVVPLPGATRVETVHSIARAAAATVPDDILGALDRHWRDEATTVAVPGTGGRAGVCATASPAPRQSHPTPAWTPDAAAGREGGLRDAVGPRGCGSRRGTAAVRREDAQHPASLHDRRSRISVGLDVHPPSGKRA